MVYFATSEPKFGQYDPAQKPATLAGGYYPPLHGLCHRMTEQKFGGISHVGAAISRPVVSPMGKQRRRKAPTIQHRTLYGEIRRYNVETWYIGNIGAPVWPIWFCSKICHVGGRILSVILWCDRPRRSLDFDSLRGAPPYADDATELPAQKISLR